MLRHALPALALATLLGSPAFAADPVPPAAAAGFTDAQKAQIEDIVRDLLTKKDPSIVMKAAEEQSKRDAADQEKKTTEGITKNKDKIYNDPTDPIAGNPKGDVTIVEFFDYNCGYCKKVSPVLKQLLNDDKNVKVIFKEYPILADSSRVAAKAALAANKQGKYYEFHNALMEHKGGFDQAGIMDIAGKLGLNKDQLKKDMDSPEIAKHLEDDQTLGMDVGAHGTPTFFIGDKVVPGAIDLAEFKSKIAEVRGGDKAAAPAAPAPTP